MAWGSSLMNYAKNPIAQMGASAAAGGIYGGFADDSSVIGGAIFGASMGATGQFAKSGAIRHQARAAMGAGLAAELYSGDGLIGMTAGGIGFSGYKGARAGIRGYQRASRAGMGRMDSLKAAGSRAASDLQMRAFKASYEIGHKLGANGGFNRFSAFAKGHGYQRSRR